MSSGAPEWYACPLYLTVFTASTLFLENRRRSTYWLQEKSKFHIIKVDNEDKHTGVRTNTPMTIIDLWQAGLSLFVVCIPNFLCGWFWCILSPPCCPLSAPLLCTFSPVVLSVFSSFVPSALFCFYVPSTLLSFQCSAPLYLPSCCPFSELFLCTFRPVVLSVFCLFCPLLFIETPAELLIKNQVRGRQTRMENWNVE